MEVDSIIPVICLVLGFFLNEIGRFFRAKRDERLNYGRLITDLLQILEEVRVIQAITSNMSKEVGTVPNVEDVRKQLIQYNISRPERFLEKFHDSVQVIAGTDPWLAHELKGDESALRSLNEKNLEHYQDKPLDYLYTLAFHDNVNREMQDHIKKAFVC